MKRILLKSGLITLQEGCSSEEINLLVNDPKYNKTFLGTKEINPRWTLLRCGARSVGFTGAIILVPWDENWIEMHPAIGMHWSPEFRFRYYELAWMWAKLHGMKLFVNIPDFLPQVQNAGTRRFGLNPVKINSEAQYGQFKAASKTFIVPNNYQPKYVKEISISWI